MPLPKFGVVRLPVAHGPRSAGRRLPSTACSSKALVTRPPNLQADAAQPGEAEFVGHQEVHIEPVFHPPRARRLEIPVVAAGDVASRLAPSFPGRTALLADVGAGRGARRLDRGEHLRHWVRSPSSSPSRLSVISTPGPPGGSKSCRKLGRSRCPSFPRAGSRCSWRSQRRRERSTTGGRPPAAWPPCTPGSARELRDAEGPVAETVPDHVLGVVAHLAIHAPGLGRPGPAQWPAVTGDDLVRVHRVEIWIDLLVLGVGRRHLAEQVAGDVESGAGGEDPGRRGRRGPAICSRCSCTGRR